MELGAAQRRDVLQHLPRHTIEPLFLAYAEWKAQRAPHHFQQLMEVVSDLEAQVEAHALGAFGHASLGSWHEQLAAAIAAAGAAASPKDLAEAFLHSLNSSSSSRKALEFA